MKITTKYTFLLTGINYIKKNGKTIPGVGDNVEQLEFSYITIRNVKWCSHLEKSLEVLFFIKFNIYQYLHMTEYPTARYLIKRTENMYIKRLVLECS